MNILYYWNRERGRILMGALLIFSGFAHSNHSSLMQGQSSFCTSTTQDSQHPPQQPPPPPPNLPSLNHSLRLAHLCPHCMKCLSSRQSLLRHIEDKHVLTQPYRCVICNTRSKTKNSLQKHHYTYHRGLPLHIVWEAANENNLVLLLLS